MTTDTTTPTTRGTVEVRPIFYISKRCAELIKNDGEFLGVYKRYTADSDYCVPVYFGPAIEQALQELARWRAEAHLKPGEIECACGDIYPKSAFVCENCSASAPMRKVETERDALRAKLAEAEADKRAAVLAEREACAAICKEHAQMATSEEGRLWAASCEAAIRARVDGER